MTDQEREAEHLRLYREVSALTVQRDRLLSERDDALGDALESLGAARSQLAQAKADLARMTEQAKASGGSFDRGREVGRAEFSAALAEALGDADTLRETLRHERFEAGGVAVSLRADLVDAQAEIERLNVEVKDLLQGVREHRAETVSAEAEADRLIQVVEGLRAELARERSAALAVGFVPITELDVVFSEGVAMGAEAVALDVSQYLAALSEVDRRHGCDRCAAALMAVATELPGVLGVMRAARVPVRRRSVKV